MIKEKINQKIKFERIKKGFSQERLANEAGLSRNAIWKIESGRANPTIDSLEKIAKALEIDFTELTDVRKVDL